MTGTVYLSPVVGTDHVSSRMVVVTLNGTTTLPAIEGIDNPPQYTCNDGDSCSAVCTDINAAGQTASPAYVATATLPLQPPTQPTITGIVFS